MKTLNALILLVMASFLLLSGCASTQYIPVGRNWQALYSAPAGDAARVSLKSTKDSYKVGELMTFEVESDKAGKVWLITIGPDDKPVLVFPNSYVKDNSIPAGRPIQLPGEMESWKLRATEPLGRNLVVAMVTGRDATLDDISSFLGDAGVSTKALSLEKGEMKYGMARQIINVER